MRLALLATLFLPSSTLAQVDDSLRAKDPGRVPAIIGVATTLAPIATGAVILAASDADAAGFLTMYGGAILGPSIGNWSAGLVGRGFAGFAIRSAIATATVYAPFAVCPGLDECTDAQGIGALAVFIAGNAALLAHAAWDLGTLPKQARRRAASVTVAPTWHRSTNAPGLAVQVVF